MEHYFFPTTQIAIKGRHFIVGLGWITHLPDESGKIGESYLPWPKKLMEVDRMKYVVTHTLDDSPFWHSQEPANPIVIWPNSPK